MPQKVVAEDNCVSLVTLWRARRSGIPGFPEPVMYRHMVCWRRRDLAKLEDALLRYDGRCKFEARRVHEKRVAALSKARGRNKKMLKKPRGLPAKDSKQQDLF